MSPPVEKAIKFITAAFSADFSKGDIIEQAKGLSKSVKKKLREIRDKGFSYLEAAVMLDDVQNRAPLCSLLINEVGFRADVKDDEGRTILHLAAIFDVDDDAIKELVRGGANPFQADKVGMMPIHIAALRGTKMAFRKLLEYPGADAVESPLGMPVHIAARAADHDLLEALSKIESPTIGNVLYGFNPLTLCIVYDAQTGDPFKCVEELVKAGADVNQIALVEKAVRCSSSKAKDLVKLLLKEGANANFCDRGLIENRALETALVLKKEDLIVTLLEHTSRFLPPDKWNVEALRQYGRSDDFLEKERLHTAGRIESLKRRIKDEVAAGHNLAAEVLLKVLQCDMPFMDDAQSLALNALEGLIGFHIWGLKYGYKCDNTIKGFYKIGCFLRDRDDEGDAEVARLAFRAVLTFDADYLNVENEMEKKLKEARDTSSREASGRQASSSTRL